MWTVIVWFLFGVVAGLFTRALLPGRNGMVLPVTIGLGVAGAFAGGLLTNMMWGATLLDLHAEGLAGGVVGAAIVLLASRARPLQAA
jgi:uncharacterized membrane protein YeaQ/YmgE (transglycosylase-associated protein family)